MTIQEKKQELLKQIEDVELKISVYQDRDEVALKRLSKHLEALEIEYLDYMVHDRGL